MKLKSVFAVTAAALIALPAWADTSLTAFGTYWSADDPGTGGGLRIKQTFLGFGAVEVRGGYVNFDELNMGYVPLDAALNLRLPFMISPYAGIGAEYIYADTDDSAIKDVSGYFGQVGVEATFLWVGIMAEIRYHEIEASFLDGVSVSAGVLIKW